MTEAQVLAYSISAITILVGVILYFIWAEGLRRKFKRDATNKETGEKMIRLEVINKDEEEMPSWGVVDSLVIRDKKSGEAYPIENMQFVKSWYPEGGLFMSLGLGVQKAILVRGKPAALVLKNYEAAPSNLANIAGILRNERFLTIAAQVQDDMAEKMAKMKKNEIHPAILYAALFTVAAIAGTSTYFCWLIIQKLAALGI